MDDQSRTPIQQNPPIAPPIPNTEGQFVAPAQPVGVAPQMPQQPTSTTAPAPGPQMQPQMQMPAMQQPISSVGGVSATTQPQVIPQQMPQVQQGVQNIPPAPPSDMPLRHVPDLTAPQQVTAFSNVPSGANIPQVQKSFGNAQGAIPTGSIPTTPPTSPKKPQNKKGPGLPKPLLLVVGGFIFLFILFMLFKVLAGMFGSNGNDKVTLTYWGLWEDTSMEQVLGDFERQHPNITVRYSKQDPHDYSKSIITRIQNGSGPDIFRYHVSWLPMLLPSLLPLSTDAISKDEFTKSYYPVMQQDLVYKGALYGIPLEVDTLALFVNKKMLEDAKLEVPTTWDSFIDVARTLTKRDDDGRIQVAGAAMGTYDNITHAPDIISLLLIQNGVDLKTMTPASNTSDALTFYTSFAKDSDNVWDTTLDPSLLAFEKGKLAMYIGYSWDIFAMQAASPDIQFGVYPVPHLPGRNSTIASYWVEGVSSKTKYPKESMLLMHFLTQKDTLTKLYTLEAKSRPFGEPYPRVDLSTLLKSNQLVYPFVSQATQASSSFFAADTYDSGINGPMNGYIANAVNSILKDTSADSAVETLTKGVSQILLQYAQQ